MGETLPTLDFEARVPVPVSFFPSSYREEAGPQGKSSAGGLAQQTSISSSSTTVSASATKLTDTAEANNLQPLPSKQTLYQASIVSSSVPPPQQQQQALPEPERHHHHHHLHNLKDRFEQKVFHHHHKQADTQSQYQGQFQSGYEADYQSQAQAKYKPYGSSSSSANYAGSAVGSGTESIHIHEEIHRRPNPAKSTFSAAAASQTFGGRESGFGAGESFRPPRSDFIETRCDTNKSLPIPSTPLDLAERRYREFRPAESSQQVTVDVGHFSRPSYNKGSSVVSEERFVESIQTVARPRARSQVSAAYPESSVSYSSASKPLALPAPPESSAKMGYYDESGHYHSFRAGMHKAADRMIGGSDDTVRETIIERPAASNSKPNTVTIPCHHIRLGDFLMLQGRPCQVIKITTSPSTGQYRYLGVDLFTKQLHEESSFVSHPAPSVVVQTMLGPVFKVYRVLDIQEGESKYPYRSAKLKARPAPFRTAYDRDLMLTARVTVTAMTETGDIKQGLPVIDQSNLYGRLRRAFAAGAGSVRVMVLNDDGNELAVDMKVVGGARL
ncbi:hypothetical protein BROUX41_006798 [Berkeleyomyces rouxiae]|uniref:uncharacterized protein n=1 Tax=Berkeleyomyces rouxiae TaxID=2035830 RepID=UPI003B7FD137